MISSGRLFLCFLHCTLLLLTHAEDGQPVRGVPGLDYPNYQTIPHTSFRCSEQEHIPGLYADPDTGCQMFHHCYEHRHESFLCPPGTIFNQAILACDYWYSADCSAATSHFNVKSQHKASNIDAKNPSVNIFNKLALLYEVKEPLSIDYASEEDTYNSVNENYQDHDNNILRVSNIHDRREGVITETYNDISYSQYENKNVNQLRILDDFESSGEPDDFDQHLYSEEKFSSLNDTENPVEFEKEYFAYDEDLERNANHHVSNEELFFDIQDRKGDSSKDHNSEDTFVKRQSNVTENRNVRKQRKRKPIYTVVEHEANIEDFTTTEMPKHKMNLNLNDPSDSPSYSQDSATTSNSVSTSSASKTKRRKPVLIQLEDSYEYKVDNVNSIKYGIPQSNIPEFSMDAEEISVKLFPSKTKRQPIDGLMQYQFNNQNSNEEITTLNNIASHESNIFHATTLSAFDDVDLVDDISMNQVFPKRKKNAIHIIDSEDNHNDYTENEELKDRTKFTPIFEEDFNTKPTTTNFEDYDKYSKSHFDSQDVEKAHEMADNNPVLVRQLEDNHNIYIQNEGFEEASTFTPTFEDEFTTQSVSTTFGNFDEFSKLHYHDLENDRIIEDGISDILKLAVDDHDVYIENEEINYATTPAPTIEDEFITQSSSLNFKDLDKTFYSTFDDHNLEIDHKTEDGHLDLVSKQYEDDSHSNFIPPYHLTQMLDGSEDSHFNQMNPGATMDVEEYGNKKYLEYIRYFPKYKNFEDFEINNNKENEDYYFTTTELSIHEMSSNVPHSEDESNRFYFNPNTIIESTFDDSGTSQSLPHQVLETSNENNFTIAFKLLSNHTNETDNARVDIVVDPLISTDINKYLINENSKGKLNIFSLKNVHTGASINSEENTSSIDSSFTEHYDSYNTLSDINLNETGRFSEKENESNIKTILHSLEFDQNIHQSDEPMDPGILDKIELESVKNIDDEIGETSSFEDSEIDSEDLTKILDDLENYHNVAQNDPISDQEHVFNPKQDSGSKAKLEDSSKIPPGKTILNIETSDINKEFTNLPQSNLGNIMKDKPIRIPRMFMPPYSRDFNFDQFSRDFNFKKLGSQNFAGVPYSMMKLKQKSMNKFLSSSMDSYGMKGIQDYYSTRTGDLLESPKISKLISIGKNLLNAKKAKLRILRRYVNY